MLSRGLDLSVLDEANYQVLSSLFMTITNANFDDVSLEGQIKKLLTIRDGLREEIIAEGLHDAATFTVDSRESMLKKAASVGVLATEDEDVRSLRELITYGLKGMAAYAEHAKNIGKEDLDINNFIYEALAATLDDTLSIDDLIALTLKTGEYGVKVMALLDEAHTSRFGNPEMTEVNIGVRENPAILISGHDLTDLEQLLEQTGALVLMSIPTVRCCRPTITRLLKNMNILWAIMAMPGGSRLKNLHLLRAYSLLPLIVSFRPEVRKLEIEYLQRVLPAIPAVPILKRMGRAKRIFPQS